MYIEYTTHLHLTKMSLKLVQIYWTEHTGFDIELNDSD